jgi:hypothetical protein
MVCCPATGCSISFGVELDAATFDKTPDFVATFYCDSCAAEHPWSKADAWIEATEFEPSTRTKTTGGVPPRPDSSRSGASSLRGARRAELGMPLAA